MSWSGWNFPCHPCRANISEATIVHHVATNRCWCLRASHFSNPLCKRKERRFPDDLGSFERQPQMVPSLTFWRWTWCSTTIKGYEMKSCLDCNFFYKSYGIHWLIFFFVLVELLIVIIIILVFFFLRVLRFLIGIFFLGLLLFGWSLCSCCFALGCFLSFLGVLLLMKEAQHKTI